jgi:hypothetical protein
MSTLLNDLPDNGTEDSTSEKYTVVGFDGDDDPWDPKNFSKWKKWGILLAVTHGAAIVTCTSSLYVSIPRRIMVTLVRVLHSNRRRISCFKRCGNPRIDNFCPWTCSGTV